MAGAHGNRVMARAMLHPTYKARMAEQDRLVEMGRADYVRGVAGDACPLPARNTKQRHLWLLGWVKAAHARAEQSIPPTTGT